LSADRRGFVLVCLLTVVVAACKPAADRKPLGRRKPPKGEAPAGMKDSPRYKLLLEMRKRRIIGKDAAGWTSEQYTLLMRTREAQALGAFRLLEKRFGTLRGFAVEHQTEPGYRALWLTADGYKKFVFLMTQDARDYFESKGAEARWVFEIRSLHGKPLFNLDGILTQEGIELYNRVRRNLPAYWRYPDKRVTGNFRPPEELLRDPNASLSSLPPLPGMKPRDGMERVAELLKSGYLEINPTELKMLASAAGSTVERLQQESSLQVIRTELKTFYLISPSDPLMSVLASRNASGKAG